MEKISKWLNIYFFLKKMYLSLEWFKKNFSFKMIKIGFYLIILNEFCLENIKIDLG